MRLLPMKSIRSLAMVLLSAAIGMASLVAYGDAQSVRQVTGGGATSIAPAVSQWAKDYNKKTGVQINYQAIGSGGGLRAIANRTVVFAASDKPLDKAELKKEGLVQFPLLSIGIVPIINVPGVKQDLALSGPVLADIFLGKITKWNDPAIEKLNPGVKLPSQTITVVYRSDGSGTTYNFTNYLSKVSAAWVKTITQGNSKVKSYATSLSWPTGIGAKGSAGVANMVSKVPGAIGYVEYAYAEQNKLAYTAMCQSTAKNGSCVKRVEAGEASFQAAAKNADWQSVKGKGFDLLLTNQQGTNSWPIAGTAFALVPAQPKSDQQLTAALKFLHWAYVDGQHIAQKLDYVTMPSNVTKLIFSEWKNQLPKRVTGPLKLN
jgi:phosphate transport system substrate-binding protein